MGLLRYWYSFEISSNYRIRGADNLSPVLVSYGEWKKERLLLKKHLFFMWLYDII